MKLVIPPQVQVAVYTYRIVTNDDLLKKMECRASCNFKEQIIRLPKDKVKAEQVLAEFLHELNHTIDDALGLKIEEDMNTARSNLLAQALTSLGIELDFSQIPEEGELR